VRCRRVDGPRPVCARPRVAVYLRVCVSCFCL
jgi:hypothetical protein